MSKWAIQKKFIFYFMIWLKNCKSPKLAFLCIEEVLQRALKLPGPPGFSLFRAFLISNNHNNMWCMISFHAFEYAYLKIWESVSKMLNPYCKVLPQASNINRLTNQWLKCSSLLKSLGPQCFNGGLKQTSKHTIWALDTLISITLSAKLQPLLSAVWIIYCLHLKGMLRKQG